MAPYDEVFARLGVGNETRNLARTLHSQAAMLTKHGSGRSLGQGHNALPAICAFLASQRLGNGDVTTDQARAAACVDRKTFESALSSVERILPNHRPSRDNQETITYRSLSKEYVAREDAFVPMVEVEEALNGCEALADGSPIDLKSSLMQCAIFYWVCTAILRVTIPDTTYFRRKLHVSPQTWSAPQRLIEKHCSYLMDDLIRKADIALSARRTRSQTRARIGRVIESSPTKSTNYPAIPSAEIPRSVENVAYSNTPLTSTGISDTSSPNTPSSQSAHKEANVRLFSAGKIPLPLVQVEELPRRRRRNLRAAFLDPSVYAWRPTTFTAHKLRRAHKWEVLMTSKYGDPWDAW